MRLCSKSLMCTINLLALFVFLINKPFINRQLINDLPIFKSPNWDISNFVLTGNVKSVQNFRHVLKSNNVKGRIFTKGYWLKGKAGLYR